MKIRVTTRNEEVFGMLEKMCEKNQKKFESAGFTMYASVDPSINNAYLLSFVFNNPIVQMSFSLGKGVMVKSMMNELKKADPNIKIEVVVEKKGR